MATILLSEEWIKKLLQPKEILSLLQSAFLEYQGTENRLGTRVRVPLPTDGTAMVLFPGLLPSIPAYTVKVHAKFPHHHPAIQGVILLHDLYQGTLLAILDSPYLTAMRTALVGILATDMLAPKDAKHVAIIGAGVQSASQLRFLPIIRNIETVSVYDINPKQANQFVKTFQSSDEQSTFSIKSASSVIEAVNQADIIITATWSKQAFLFSEMLPLESHITVLGSDELGKQEVSAELIQKSVFVCDDRPLNLQMGAIASAGLTETSIHAELGEILNGTKKGRQHQEQITIFNGVGLPFQDLVATWSVYSKWKNSQDVLR